MSKLCKKALDVSKKQLYSTVHWLDLTKVGVLHATLFVRIGVNQPRPARDPPRKIGHNAQKKTHLLSVSPRGYYGNHYFFKVVSGEKKTPTTVLLFSSHAVIPRKMDKNGG